MKVITTFYLPNFPMETTICWNRFVKDKAEALEFIAEQRKAIQKAVSENHVLWTENTETGECTIICPELLKTAFITFRLD